MAPGLLYQKETKDERFKHLKIGVGVADKNCGRIVENKGFARPIPSKPTLS